MGTRLSLIDHHGLLDAGDEPCGVCAGSGKDPGIIEGNIMGRIVPISNLTNEGVFPVCRAQRRKTTGVSNNAASMFLRTSRLNMVNYLPFNGKYDKTIVHPLPPSVGANSFAILQVTPPHIYRG